MHVYEVRPRKDHRGVDLISDALPFSCLWYDRPNAASNAIGYATQYSRSHGAVIRVYDEAGNVIALPTGVCGFIYAELPNPPLTLNNGSCRSRSKRPPKIPLRTAAESKEKPGRTLRSLPLYGPKFTVTVLEQV